MTSYTLLIVDDEPNNFDTIEALLPHESYRLHYASSGEQAIASLDKFNPDVILLDVMMPVLNGIETCKRIKLMSQWQAVPIIMVTALSSKEDLARCLAAGADDFLSKPISGLELRARVNSMLRLKKQHDRVRALTQLQRNNINILANSLSEMRLDLAVGFPHEFNDPLNTVSENIERLLGNIESLDRDDTIALLKASSSSTGKLRKLADKFWFYLQLILESPTANNRELSVPKEIVDRLLTERFGKDGLPPAIGCEIEYVPLAVSRDRAHWIFSELLDYLFDMDDRDRNLKIDGRVIDNYFHFSVSSSLQGRPDKPRQGIADLINFNPLTHDDRELKIGLKIVKKIVEIYDGIFLYSGDDDRQETTIYLTLPLISVDPSLGATNIRPESHSLG